MEKGSVSAPGFRRRHPYPCESSRLHSCNNCADGALYLFNSASSLHTSSGCMTIRFKLGDLCAA
eukprot:8974778-Pyramimonas_sp.AAC.1